MTYEELEIKHDNLKIIEMDLSGVNGLKGLYADNSIAIEKSMTQVQKSCVLAEELGHYYTTSGNIIDQTETMNRKQEYRARLYGYNIKIGLQGIVKAFENGCRNLREVSEHLEVTEEYLLEALECYKRKYGIRTEIDNYTIWFEPTIAVMRRIESSGF